MRSLCKQVFLSALFVSVLSHGAIAATDKPAQTEVIAPENTVVLRINGKDITKGHFDAVVDRLIPAMSLHSSISDDKLKSIQKKAIEKILNSELIYKYAKDNKKAEVDQKEIDEKIDEIKKRLPQDTTLTDVLKRSNMTMEDLREDFRQDIVVAATEEEMSLKLRKKAEDTVTEDFMRKYYDNNLAKFKEPEQIHVRTILIKADPSGGVKEWNAKRKRIEEILNTINQGMDFAEAAREYSEDPYAESGGDMGWAHKGSVMEEFDRAIADMKVGEIAGPFASLYGYHLAKLEGIKPAVQRKFEELNHANLTKDLQDKEFKALWNGWIQGMRNAAKIEYITPLN